MAGFEEDRAVMAGAHDKAQQSLGPLEQAHSYVEEGRAMLLQITETSAQAETHEVLAQLSRAMEHIVQAQQAISAGVQTSEGVATRL